MNWGWATSLDQLWRSPSFPMWLTLAAAGFFGIIVLLTLLRAEKSVANGALTVITLLAVGIAVAATIRGFGRETVTASHSEDVQVQATAAMPALSCIDDLAGDAVENGCERALFGSPESTAAAVSYAAFQITRLTSFGDVASADKVMSPPLLALRRAVEQDRYGLFAYVLTVREGCKPTDCAAFHSLTERDEVVAHMEQRIYEQRISRYATAWNVPAQAPAPVATLSAVPGMPPLPVEMPTGRPTNAEFPTAASIPPVNIMTPEPPTGGAAAAHTPAAATAQSVPTPRPAPPKRQAAPRTHAAAPVRLTPAPASTGNQN